ncbi:MAG: DUF924 family protein [Pseudomonadota bacterium]|nr:DUF924 family protein [Pseudomonadota bacterium]
MYQAVLKFWFQEITRESWWIKDSGFDAAIRERFAALHCAAHLGECREWRKQPHGRLAEIIVLDQFPRNMYRGTPRAFTSDAMALALAQEAIDGGHDAALAPLERAFLYMPFQHSESRIVQAESVRLFEALGEPEQYDFAVRHKAIIDQFGRFPHRNEILGRQSTVEEEAFLKTPGSSF